MPDIMTTMKALTVTVLLQRGGVQRITPPVR